MCIGYWKVDWEGIRGMRDLRMCEFVVGSLVGVGGCERAEGLLG